MSAAERIVNDFKARIDHGELTPGAELLSEHELMDRFGVARGTVREALGRLTRDGYLEPPQQGKRRRLRVSPQISIARIGVSRSVSFGEHLTEIGAVASDDPVAGPNNAPVFKLEGEARFDSSEIMDCLQVRRDDEVLWFKRVRFVREQPAVIQLAVVPARLSVVITLKDLVPGGVTACYRRAGIVRSGADARICATLASRDEAKMLSVQTGSPLLLEHRTSWFVPKGKRQARPYELLVTLVPPNVWLGVHWEG